MTRLGGLFGNCRMNDLSDTHKPVLLKEAIDGLAIKKDGIYIDAIFGRGGHAREV